MTESGLGADIRGNKEAEKHGSVGRLPELTEAKIVNPVTGEALPPGQKGELLLRGPAVMKGNETIPITLVAEQYSRRKYFLSRSS